MDRYFSPMIAQAQGQIRPHCRTAGFLIKNRRHLLLLSGVLFAILSQSGCSGTVGANGSGSGIPGLNANTATLNFGNVNVGAASTLGVTFTNTSGSNLTVSNVVLAGSGFSLSGISNGMNVAPGASVAMTVSFAPSGFGAAAGSITVANTSANPSVIIALSGTGVSGHKANLSWSPSSSSNVTGYYIYRGTTSGGPYSRLNGSAPDPNTTNTDFSVQSGLTYYYVVTAVDWNGFESSYSNEASALIP